MNLIQRLGRSGLLLVFLALSSLGACRSETGATPPAIASIRADQLPPEAQQTIALIERGGPFPYARDGIEFKNREALLPAQKPRYYKEYTVITPGLRTRGARRIINGQRSEYYYTPDHYRSFLRVQP